MEIKTFTASNMAEALLQVKRQFGADALVLHTRSYKQGGVFGFGAKNVVEVTVSRNTSRKTSRTRRGTAARQASIRGHIPSTSHAKVRASTSAGELIRRTYAACQQQAVTTQAALSSEAPRTTSKHDSAHSLSAANPFTPTSAGSLQTSSHGSLFPTQAISTPTSSPAAGTSSMAGRSVALQADQLTQEMQSVRRMVERMMQQQQNAATAPDQMPDTLFDQYMNLLKQEVAQEIAQEIIQNVSTNLVEDELKDIQKVRQEVSNAIERFMPALNQDWSCPPTDDGRPRTIALIGPTGVGKTTTIAKLAATFKLKQAKHVGLITLDTYRIAAVDQLRTYADIIGLPLHIANTPAELEGALTRCAGCEVILIDTAGRSQRDDPKLDQLKAFIQTANPHEVHLVLSSTCTQSVMLESVKRFSEVRTDRIIFTKLDEAVSFGVLLNVCRQVGKKLSYLTTGQEVPHQIEPTHGKRLAQLVLGGELTS